MKKTKNRHIVMQRAVNIKGVLYNFEKLNSSSWEVPVVNESQTIEPYSTIGRIRAQNMNLSK